MVMQTGLPDSMRWWRARPLWWTAMCFALGIVAARACIEPASAKPGLGVCVVGAAALGVAALKWRRRAAVVWLVLATVCLAGAGRWMCVEVARGDGRRIRAMFIQKVIEQDEPVEVFGTLARAPEAMPDGVLLVLEVERLTARGVERQARGQVRLLAAIADEKSLRQYEALRLNYGVQLKIACRLRREAGYRNPGVAPFAEILDTHGFDATGSIKSPLLVQRLGDGESSNLRSAIYDWRGRMLGRIHQTFNRETAAVLSAALLGNERYLSREVADKYRAGGTFHLLVISGMHISVIGGAMLLLLRLFTARKLFQWAGAVVLLWAYTLAVGAESPVTRAAVMFTLVSFVAVVKRSWRAVDGLNVLGAAALILTAWRAEDLFNSSFHLTFLAVLGLTTIAAPVIGKLKQVGEWMPGVASPHPPVCPKWFRSLGESLFWNERAWRTQQQDEAWHYQIAKSPAAIWLQRVRLQILWRAVCLAFIASTAVQVLMLPLQVLYFHRFAAAGLVLNVWVGFAFAVMTITALISLACAAIQASLALPFIRLTEMLNATVPESVNPLLRAGLASYRIAEYTGAMRLIYVVYFVLCAVLIGWLKRWHPLPPKIVGTKAAAALPARQKNDSMHRAMSARQSVFVNGARWLKPCVALLFIGCTVGILFHPLSARFDAGKLRVDFLDVGQGDAALVTMPDGTTMLVDGGGQASFGSRAINLNSAREAELVTTTDEKLFEVDRKRVGEAVVAEVLWHKGRREVDYLVATHADADHIQGLTDIARNFKIKAAFVGVKREGDADYDELARELRRRDVPIYELRAGDVLHFGDVGFEVWHPLNNVPSKKTNDDSVVACIKYGERQVLLTGDVEARGESEVLRRIENAKVDVVKVAHHGSRTSSIESFVQRVRPAIAVISVGERSPFDHPHREVIERWQRYGARVMTTGESGMISIITDGREISVEEYAKRF